MLFMRARSCVQAIPARGFTSIELGITLFIMSLVLAGVIVPMQAQIETRRIDETQRMLDQAREMLLDHGAHRVVGRVGPAVNRDVD